MASENFEDAKKEILHGKEKSDAIKRVEMAVYMAERAANKLARSMGNLEAGKDPSYYKSRVDYACSNFRLFVKQSPRFNEEIYNSELRRRAAILIGEMVLYDAKGTDTPAGYAGREIMSSVRELTRPKAAIA